MNNNSKRFVTGQELIGYGNENGVRRLEEEDGTPVERRRVLKEGNSAFFGWQNPNFDSIKRYLDVLREHGVRLRNSVELHKDPVIERAQNNTMMRVLKTFFTNTLTLGFVLKMLTKQ